MRCIAVCRHLARKALVLAAGVWTGGLLAGATGDAGWEALLQPRRGHLLEMPAPEGMPRVVHGMMEMSYTKVRDVRTYWYGSSLLLAVVHTRKGWP